MKTIGKLTGDRGQERRAQAALAMHVRTKGTGFVVPHNGVTTRRQAKARRFTWKRERSFFNQSRKPPVGLSAQPNGHSLFTHA